MQQQQKQVFFYKISLIYHQSSPCFQLYDSAAFSFSVKTVDRKHFSVSSILTKCSNEISTIFKRSLLIRAALCLKASKVSGAIRRVFRFSSQKLLWPAFLTYVLPILTYCSPAWNTNVAGNIKLIESVQRRFTKRISELKHLPFSDRLHQLGALTVQNRLLFNDMVCVHR